MSSTSFVCSLNMNVNFFVKVNEALVNFSELLREKAVVSRDSTGL